jgi:hypothetical protein
MTTITISIPKTDNPKHGFHGTIWRNKRRAWNAAIIEFYKATGVNPFAIRVWLDSRYGRHFADKVNEMAAVYRTFEDHTVEDAVALCVKEHFKYSICGKDGFVRDANVFLMQVLQGSFSNTSEEG